MSQINAYTLDIKAIEKKMGVDKGSIKLNMLKKLDVLPFDSRGSIKSDIKNYDVIIKVIFQQMMNVTPIELDNEAEMMERILSSVETKHKSELKNIINELYFDNGQLSTFHPKVLVYQGKVKKSIENIARFFVKTFADESLKDQIEKMVEADSLHLLDQIMIDSLPEFKTKSNIGMGDCFALIPSIQVKFIEDFKLISNDEQMFMSNIAKLIKYYMFFYTSQTIMNLKAGFTSNTKIYPTYYFVEWEKISKSRPGYVQGWKMIYSKSKDIFAYTNLIQILNQTTDESFKGTFSDVKVALDALSDDEKVRLSIEIDELNQKIRDIHKMPSLNIGTREKVFGEYECVDRLLTTLSDCRDKGTSNRDGAFDKYETSILDVAKTGFLKARGQLGLTLNFTQEWIIFFTKLAIGDNEKIRLNVLWSVLEDRGLYFDKFTKKEIVSYFEKINVLEKKSDSGDAQYVRIL